MDALEYIRSIYPNAITPRIIRTGWLVEPSYAYELSKGDGIEPGSTIYGVTIAQRDAIDHFRSTSFYDLQEAEDYIREQRADLQAEINA